MCCLIMLVILKPSETVFVTIRLNWIQDIPVHFLLVWRGHTVTALYMCVDQMTWQQADFVAYIYIPHSSPSLLSDLFSHSLASLARRGSLSSFLFLPTKVACRGLLVNLGKYWKMASCHYCGGVSLQYSHVWMQAVHSLGKDVLEIRMNPWVYEDSVGSPVWVVLAVSDSGSSLVAEDAHLAGSNQDSYG